MPNPKSRNKENRDIVPVPAGHDGDSREATRRERQRTHSGGILGVIDNLNASRAEQQADGGRKRRRIELSEKLKRNARIIEEE
jgi:hypothetical protein